jgi:hypothetical protein
MIGQMFEQQMRIAQTLGAVAIASNPLLAPSPRTFTRAVPEAETERQPSQTPQLINQISVAPARPTRTASLPTRTPNMFARTHATPV